MDKTAKELSAFSDYEFGLILRSVWENRSLDRERKIQVPTLLMVGEKDGIADHSRVLKNTIPGAQLLVVPESNHSIVFDRPELISEEILKFLEKVPVAGA